MDAVTAVPPPIQSAKLRGIDGIAWAMILACVLFGLLSLLVAFIQPLAPRTGNPKGDTLRLMAFLGGLLLDGHVHRGRWAENAKNLGLGDSPPMRGRVRDFRDQRNAFWTVTTSLPAAGLFLLRLGTASAFTVIEMTKVWYFLKRQDLFQAAPIA